MKNGRADHDDDPDRDPKIARIEDARRRRQLGLGGETGKTATAGPRLPRGGGNIKELLVGALIVAMAIGFLVHLTRPLWQGAMSLAP